jgi:hypothetical protein
VIDNPRLPRPPGRLLQKRKQLFDEEERGQVISLHLDLEPILGPCVGKRHDAGVVDQDVDADVREMLADGSRRRTHAREVLQIAGDIGEVGLSPLPLQLLKRRLGASREAVQEDDVRTQARCHAGGHEACARGRAADDDNLALLTRQGRDQARELDVCGRDLLPIHGLLLRHAGSVGVAESLF